MAVRSRLRWIADDLPEAYYTIIPNALARSSELSSSAVKVALFFWSHKDGFAISEKSIASALGMGRNTVGRAIEQLVEQRWLARIRSKNERGAIQWEYRAHPARQLEHYEIGPKMESSLDAKMGPPKKTKNLPTPSVGREEPWG